MRYNGYTLSAWENSHEMKDGRTLTIKFTRSTMEATFNDPEESEDSETRFYIDGLEVLREELPDDVTDEIIEKLELDAEYDPREDFGFPDY